MRYPVSLSTRVSRRKGRSALVHRLFGRQRFGGAARPIGVESLEDRRLLAITVTQDNLDSFRLASGAYEFTDSSSIVFAPGTVLDAGDGAVEFSAPSVRIGDGAQVTTTGVVSIKATNVLPDFGSFSNLWNQAFTVVQALSSMQARIEIGVHAAINAGSVSLTASAGDVSIPNKVLFTGDGLPLVPLAGQPVGLLLSTFLRNDIYALPLSIQVKQPQTTIAIDQGASITAAADVTVSAVANADASGQAIYSVLANNRLNDVGGGGAIGFSYVDAASTVTMAGSASIHAAGSVRLNSTTTSVAQMTSRVTLNQGIAKTNPSNVEIALAGTRLESTSRIRVEENALVAAGKNVDIKTSVNDTNTLKANTASYRDGRAGIVAGYGSGYGTSEVLVDGTILAGQVDVPGSVTFDPALTVDGVTDSIVFPGATDFHTGDEVIYSSGDGGAIPGLFSGGTYYAIVDRRDPKRLQLASSAEDARAGRAIDLGRYPTLTDAAGRSLPITRLDAAADDALLFDSSAWPDGSPLFRDGQTVRYSPAPGQYLGINDAGGALAGPLAAGDYRVRVLPLTAGQTGTAIQLLPIGGPADAGTRIDLNDNPVFRRADGTLLQIASFDADSGQVSFLFPKQGTGDGEVPFPVPDQTVDLVNGEPITYVEAFGCHVPGLEDGKTYHAIVDPAAAGTIRLAASAAQAAAADPRTQNALPSLELPGGTRVEVGTVEPGTGLVFASDPGIAAGTPVVYREVPGKPVGGLVDGVTYFAWPLDDPFFEPEWPRYVVGLRTAADPSLPLIDLTLDQSMSFGGVDLPISGVDTASGAMALALPDAVGLPTASSDTLEGGTATVRGIPAGSRQVWTTAHGGAFTISFPDGTARRSTAAIPFDATAATVMEAVNALSLAAVRVTAAFGRGTYSSPWTLMGTGLDDVAFDDSSLVDGATLSRLTASEIAAVSTTASGGTFLLSFPGSGSFAPVVSGAIPCDATAEAVRDAVNGAEGILAPQVLGSGTTDDPWLVAARVQPLRTGDELVFHDAWGASSPGLVDGQHVWAVVENRQGQGKAGSVIVRLAPTRADAVADLPRTLPLDVTVSFGVPVTVAMGGTGHSLVSALSASGISLAAVLKSSDQQSAKAANGSEPKFKDILTRGDIDYGGSKNFSNLLRFRTDANNDSLIGKAIGAKADGAVNDLVTVSASGSRLAVTNTARVVVGGSARLATPGKVSLASSISEKVKSNVESTVSKPNKGKAAAAIAVDIVDITNTAKTIVAANASVTGGGGVSVDSKIVYPWAFESSWLGDNWIKPLAFDTLNTIAKLLGGKGGLDEWFVNHWVDAGAKQKDFKQAQLATTVTASVAVVSLTNDCTSRIEDGARINVDVSGISMPAANPVTVSATTDVAQTGFAGLVYVDLSPEAITKKLKKNDKFFNSNLVAAQGQSAWGGSVGLLTVDNTTRAYVGGREPVGPGVPAPSGPLLVSTGTGALSVKAANDLLLVQLGQAGADTSSWGISGTASVLDVKNQKADAAIFGGEDPARAAVIRAGRVDVNAADTSFVIPIAGAVLVSKNKGVGVSTAIAIVDRDVAARVGGRDDATGNVGWIDRLESSGGVSLSASAGGAITPSALAAATGSSVKAQGIEQQNPAEGGGGAPAPVEGRWGVAISGDLALALVTDAVQSTVNTAGQIVAAGTGATLSLQAENDTLIQATAGAAALLSGDGSSFGLAGSAAVVTASSTVTTLLRQVTVQGFALDVSAADGRRIGGLAASGSGARVGNTGTTSVQLVPSVVVTSIGTTTRARIDSIHGGSLADVSLRARNNDRIWGAAGSFLFNVSLNAAPAAGRSPGNSLGVGMAVAKQTVVSETTARIDDSDLGATAVAVIAADRSQILTFAAGVVGTGAGSSLSGMWADVSAKSAVTAAIEGGSIDVAPASDAREGKGVAVTAVSAMLLVTVAGDLVVGRSTGGSWFAVGAAVAVVGCDATVDSHVGRSARVRARRGNVSVSSRSRAAAEDDSTESVLANLAMPHRDSNAVWTYAVGVVGSNANVSLASSFSWNRLTVSRTATISGGAEVTAERGTIDVRATDEAGIYSGAGTIAVAAGKKAAVAAGAAVAKNTVTATTRARVDGAAATTLAPGGDVRVTATAAASIWSLAVGGEYSGKVGVGTSLVLGDITQTVDAGVTGTAVQRSRIDAAGAVAVIATDRARIVAGAGQVSLANGAAAAGAAAARNRIESDTRAVIERADVKAAGTISVGADAGAEIRAYAVGVSGAWSEDALFSGAGSGTGNSLVRKVLAAVQMNAALESGGLSVEAVDTSSIDTVAGALAIQVAGLPAGADKPISAAMGISVSTNAVGSADDESRRSFVSAIVRDASVVARGQVGIKATASLTVQSVTAAGAGEFTSGSGMSGGVALAGAGAGSRNSIQLDVEAAARAASVSLPTGMDFSIEARNTSSIAAIAGGVAFGGSGGGGKGLAVTVGAAAAVNDVAIQTTSLIERGATVLTGGKVTLDALGEAAIKAVTVGVAGHVKTAASSVPFDLTGAGSASVNTVSSTTLAAIRGTVAGPAAASGGGAPGRAGAVTVIATDRPAITAGAGSLAGALALGGGQGSVVTSVGVSTTINEVSGSARALVEGGEVRSRGDVSLSATFDRGNSRGESGSTIYALSAAGSADLSFGGAWSALFPLAGAGNRNVVAFDTEAAITDGADVRAEGAVRLDARDRSSLYSNAGGVGFGVASASGTAVAVAVGAAYSGTTVTNSVRAGIDSSTVVAAGDVGLTAEEIGEIESVGYGVALTVAVANASVSAAGSGAKTSTTIRDSVAAEIVSAAVESQAGAVSIEARDMPTVTSRAGAGALAVAVGNGVALAPGVVLLETDVHDTVRARIDAAFSEAGPGRDPIVRSAAATSLVAESKASVASFGVAVAASVAVGEWSPALAGSGGHSKIDVGNTVVAGVLAGSTTARSVSLTAIDHDALEKNTFGSGAGAVGVIGGSIGVSIAETTVADSVTATIGASAVTAVGGGIAVDVRGGNTIATMAVPTSVAVGIGGAGAGGRAIATDASTFTAAIAPGAILAAAGPLVVTSRGAGEDAAAPDGTIRADALVIAGGLVGVGAVDVRAKDATARQATIGDGVDLRAVSGLVLSTAASPNVKATSYAYDLGAVAVTVNQSTAEVSGKAWAATGTGVTLPDGAVVILASGATTIDVDQTGVTPGGLAAGATLSTGISALDVRARLGGGTRTSEDRDGDLVVRATNRDVATSVRAVAGSGGVFAGFGAKGTLTDSTVTRASIGGGSVVHAGNVDLSDERVGAYDLSVDAMNIGVGLGVGIARASYTAPVRAADGFDRVRLSIGAGTQLVATGTVGVSASHRIERLSSAPTVRSRGGGAVDGRQSVSDVEAGVPATIVIASRVGVTSGISASASPGGITILPTAALQVNDSASLSAGGLVQGGRVSSTLVATVAPTVTMGDDVRLSSHGRIDVGTTAFVASRSGADASTGALVGGSGAYATSTVKVTQSVTIGSRARFDADGTLSVTPGDDPTGASSTSLDLESVARCYVYGLIAIPFAEGTSSFAHSSTLSFADGARVTSGGNMFLSARAMKPGVIAKGTTSINDGTTRDGSSVADIPALSSAVRLEGSFLAGRDNRVDIRIPNDAGGGFTGTVQAEPASVSGTPIATAWRYDPQFDPQAFIDRAGYSADVAAALRAGVALGKVGAIVFAPGSGFSPTPLQVSGGSVTVSGDSLDAAGASIEARTARITIVNDSPDYLVLGRMTIANIEGGRVRFASANGQQAPDPRGVKVLRDESSVPTIVIQQNFPGAVGGSAYGPAVFLAAAVENLGGDVTIRNVQGSFGQTGTIAAKRISIDTPNGVFAVDTPTADWVAAGTPAAQFGSAVFWPGGSPQGPLDGNRAVMQAISAIASGYGKEWNTAKSDDELNRLVYGDPREPTSRAFVFFGGAVPQYDGSGNTRPVNESLARQARPDGQSLGWQLTDKGRTDHTWAPKLQKLPSEFSWNGSLPPASGVSVRGQVILVNAKTVNVNGTLEAGSVVSGDQSVVIPKGEQAVLEDYRRRYRLGQVTDRFYRIPEGDLGKENAADRLIGVTFDAATGQLLVDAASSSGGGSVSITGRIINTGGPLAGKIKVQGGSGDLVVRNDTRLELVTSALETGGGGKHGIVRITDLDVDNPAQRQTAFVYDGTQILVYRGAAGADLLESGNATERIPGDVAGFSPRPGARWQWQLDATLTRDVDLRLSDRPYSGAAASGWRFVGADVTPDRPWGPWRPTGGAGAGDVVYANDPNTFSERLTASSDATYGNGQKLRLPPRDQWTFDTGVSDGFEFYYPSRVELGMTMSVKADWPIGIDFAGTSFGRVRVVSVGDMLVGGRTSAKDVRLESSDGSIAPKSTGEGSVEAGTLDLHAAYVVGTESAPLSVSVESLTAQAGGAGIWLDAVGVPGGPLTIDGVSVPQGTVHIDAAGDVRQGRKGITAASVALASLSGGIGELSQPLVISPGSSQGGGLVRTSARAVGDIVLRQDAGDMLVGSMVSTDGSVSLTTRGSILDGLTWTVDPVAADARIASFRALGVTDPEAYRGDVAAFEAKLTARYPLYWSVITRGDELDLWRTRTAASLGVVESGPGSPSDDQIHAYVAGLRTELEQEFTDSIGPSWRTLPAFLVFDPSYSYRATSEQVDRFRKDRIVVDEDRLSVFLNGQSLGASPTTSATPRPANISARNATLLSAAGSLGRADDPVTIPAVDFASGHLTDRQKLAVTLASQPGEARFVKDAFGTMSAVILDVPRPLFLAVSGRLDADAPAGVAVSQPQGDLHVGQIGSSGGRVSVVAGGNLLNASGGGISMWGAPVGFDDPADWSQEGNAGQTFTRGGGLFVPAYANTSSATWFGTEVPTDSFRASFTYLASVTSNDSVIDSTLRFVLESRTSGRSVGLGLSPGTYQKNPWTAAQSQTSFDSPQTGRQWNFAPFAFPGRPVYVTLVYDAPSKRMTATISDQPEGVIGQRQTLVFQGVDLKGSLGQSARLGFLGSNGGSPTGQAVTNFTFASGGTLPGQKVDLPGDTKGSPWVIDADPASAGFVNSSTVEGPRLTFPDSRNATSAAWYSVPVRVSDDFSISFRYRYSGTKDQIADGMAIVLRSADGPLDAMGYGGGSLGYAGIPGAKVGYLINIYGNAGTRFDTTGTTGGYDPVRSFRLGEWADIRLSYDAQSRTLRETIVSSSLLTSREYPGVDLTALLGGKKAIFGVTAASGGYGAKQEIQSLVFDSPPIPLSMPAADDRTGWELVGGAQTMANGTLTIPGLPFTSTASWYGRPVTTGDFDVSFTYRASPSSGQTRVADGMAFVLQRGSQGVAAIGGPGSDLGYKGIAGPKVGVLFNIYGTPGIRLDTGSESGAFEPVSWLVGGPVSVRMAYDTSAARLTLTLSRVGSGSITRTWNVDLHAILGSQAFMGITSGTGSVTATQVISDFSFRDRGGVSSDKIVGDGSATVSLRSWNGDIGASGDEIAVYGNLQAVAPLGEIHTDPPPKPKVTLRSSGGQRTDGVPVTNDRTLVISAAAALGDRVVFSIDGGRTWRPTWTPVEGLNQLLVARINPRGQRSEGQSIRFVLDTTPPAAPRAALADGVGSVSRVGKLSLGAVEQGARVEYSVNGGPWSAAYAPVEGANSVRVRQIDLAGNVSKPSAAVSFTKKTTVAAVIASLANDTGTDRHDRVTWDPRLFIQGQERLARVEYSIDGGKTWTGRFVATLGMNRLFVRQIDRVGNVSAATEFSFTLVQPPHGTRSVFGILWPGIR